MSPLDVLGPDGCSEIFLEYEEYDFVEHGYDVGGRRQRGLARVDVPIRIAWHPVSDDLKGVPRFLPEPCLDGYSCRVEVGVGPEAADPANWALHLNHDLVPVGTRVRFSEILGA